MKNSDRNRGAVFSCLRGCVVFWRARNVGVIAVGGEFLDGDKQNRRAVGSNAGGFFVAEFVGKERSEGYGKRKERKDETSGRIREKVRKTAKI